MKNESSEPVSPPRFPLEADGKMLGFFTRPTLTEIRGNIDTILSKSEEPPPVAPAPSPPCFDQVIQIVANFYRAPVECVCGRSRERKAAWPRQVAMTLCWESLPHLSAVAIGKIFGRTHSTLSHARRTVLERQRNPQTRADLTRLRELVKRSI